MLRILSSIMFATLAILTAGARVYEVEVGEFTKLVIPDNLKVIYDHNTHKPGTASFECEDKYADALMFENLGKGTLKVMISPDFIDKPLAYPTIYLNSEFLTNIESSSADLVVIQGLPRQANLKAVLFGNGTLELKDLDVAKLNISSATGHGTIKATGKATDSVLKVAGCGHVDASELKSDKVSCHVFGAGQIHCHPLEELKLKGLGSTTVYYSGHPATIKKHGIGKLVQVGD